LIITNVGSLGLVPHRINHCHQHFFCRNHYVLRWRTRSGTSQGAHHQSLHQLRWWPLPELPTAPPKGAAIDVLINFSGGHYRNSRQHLPGGPPSMSSSTSMVANAGTPSSTSRGPTIDVLLNYGDSRCRNYQHHPQGSSHRRLVKLGTCCQYFSSDTYQKAPW
jgi:hypothetical protein